MQADPTEYRQLDLKVHTFLANVELHDVWLVELEGGGPDRTMEDVRRCFTPQTATSANASVQMLFAIRRWVGRVFRWDSDQDRWHHDLYCHRLTDEERERSLIDPGTDDGLFRIVYVYPNESLSEVRNATVHAFSCMALRQTMSGYRLYWAIYVKPIGRWTATYMRVIDPFRRAIVYPAIINRVRSSWTTMFGG